MATYETTTEVRDMRAEDEAARERERAQGSKHTVMVYYHVETGPDGEALRDRVIDAATAPVLGLRSMEEIRCGVGSFCACFVSPPGV